MRVLYIVTLVLYLCPLIGTLIWAGIWYLIGSKAKSDELMKYSYELAASVDQHVNAITGGNRDLTISQRLAFRERLGTASWYEVKLARFVDWLFWIAVREEDHIANSIRED